MDKLKKAERLARKYHRGQVDKAGANYIDHLKYVSAHVNRIDEKIVGLLHDSVEDTNIDPEEIREKFGPVIYDAVLAMTHIQGEDYFAYISRVKMNPIARTVKLADLSHNSDISRIPNPTDKDFARVAKYRKAEEMLRGASEEI